jgi:hypothetical protein
MRTLETLTIALGGALLALACMRLFAAALGALAG